MNGIDRVFVSALNTVKRLPTSPSSPKPPLEDRLLLYGLFKQSMEGDIPESMFQSLTLEPIDEEEEANREKTDAWAQQRGTTKTEAKKLYITTLIRSMRQYGSKTETARSLIDELEFVWNQVNNNHDEHDDPLYSRSNSGSRPHQPDEEEEEDENDDLDDELARALPNVYRTAPPSPQKGITRTSSGQQRQIPSLTLPASQNPSDDEKWRKQVEVSLQQIRAELASVRETLLLTSPSQTSLMALLAGPTDSSSLLSIALSRCYKVLIFSVYVVAYDVLILGVIWCIFRNRGDERAKKVEEWVKRLWNWSVSKMRVRVRTGIRSIDERR